MNIALVAQGFDDSKAYEAASENYVKKTLDLYERVKHLIKPGMSYDSFVEHDDWCKGLNGGVGCNCNPDVYVEIDGKLYK